MGEQLTEQQSSALSAILVGDERLTETYRDIEGRLFAITDKRALIWDGDWRTYILPGDDMDIDLPVIMPDDSDQL